MIKQYQKPKIQAQGLQRMYWHWMPRWMIFIQFMRRGFFNGFVTFNWKRIFCWYGRHDWNLYKYFKWENEEKTNRYTHQCRRCCIVSKEYQ